jgi:hypothetical protein
MKKLIPTALALAAFTLAAPGARADIIDGVDINVWDKGSPTEDHALFFTVVCYEKKPTSVLIATATEEQFTTYLQAQKSATRDGTRPPVNGQTVYMVYVDKDGKFRSFNDKFEIDAIFKAIAEGKAGSRQLADDLNLSTVARQARNFCSLIS